MVVLFNIFVETNCVFKLKLIINQNLLIQSSKDQHLFEKCKITSFGKFINLIDYILVYLIKKENQTDPKPLNVRIIC